jgi:hypothetical protein
MTLAFRRWAGSSVRRRANVTLQANWSSFTSTVMETMHSLFRRTAAVLLFGYALLAIPVVAFVIGTTAPAASADETGAESRFEEHPVEFHEQDVNLAGSLLLPKSEVAVPAVVFVHGAGQQTREAYRVGNCNQFLKLHFDNRAALSHLLVLRMSKVKHYFRNEFRRLRRVAFEVHQGSIAAQTQVQGFPSR